MINQIMTNATPKDSEDSKMMRDFYSMKHFDGLNFRCFNNMFKEDPTYTFFNSNTIRSSSDDDEFFNVNIFHRENHI